MDRLYLGIDTSNYTTSVALYNGTGVLQEKKPLKVKPGALGLKQSDAVFSHTVQLPELMERLMKDVPGYLSGVGVSEQPRMVEGSYMPCFLAGVNAARCIAAAQKVPLYPTAHQLGHIMAALFSVNKTELCREPFVAFHISGGTTEALLVTPDEREIIHAQVIASSLDLKAGQAIDRVGVMLGLPFPAGAALDELSQHAKKHIPVRVTLKGMDCCLSGLENQCRSLFKAGERPEDIACFCIEFICKTLDRMTERICAKYPGLPLVFAGGVTSNRRIKEVLSQKYGAYFAEPCYSSDNAAGVAILAALKDGLNVF